MEVSYRLAGAMGALATAGAALVLPLADKVRGILLLGALVLVTALWFTA